MAIPDRHGRFGPYGGRYVPETLMPALLELEEVYQRARRDKGFQAELKHYLKEYVGRPTPLYFAQRLTKRLGGAKIYLKREDLCHTGQTQQVILGRLQDHHIAVIQQRTPVTDGRGPWRRRGQCCALPSGPPPGRPPAGPAFRPSCRLSSHPSYFAACYPAFGRRC